MWEFYIYIYQIRILRKLFFYFKIHKRSNCEMRGDPQGDNNYRDRVLIEIKYSNVFWNKNKMYVFSVSLYKESRHDMQFTEIFISEFDWQILTILGSNKLIKLHLLIFVCVCVFTTSICRSQ